MMVSCARALFGYCAQLRQISAQRSTVSSPRMVCSRITPGCVGVEAVGGVGGQQRHVAAARRRCGPSSSRPARRRCDRALLAGGRESGCRASRARPSTSPSMHEGELVVGAGAPLARCPRRGSPRARTACSCRPRPSRRASTAGDLEDVREGVVLRVVVDQLDGAFAVVVERPELSRVRHLSPRSSTVTSVSAAPHPCTSCLCGACG